MYLLYTLSCFSALGSRSTRAYTVQWLRPGDAAAIAAVEAVVHSPEHRAGERLIRAQLEETEPDGRNLSLGLYYGTRLVGFGLCFVMRNRHEMAEFFDAPLPPGLDPDERTLYIADYVVMPRHRRASRLLSAKFAATVRTRDDLRGLPVDAFSTAEYAGKWQERSKFTSKMGWRAAGCFPFWDEKLGTTLNWLRFERVPEPPANSAERPTLEGALEFATARGPITVGWLSSLNAWDGLRTHWDELLTTSGEISPLHTWEYLRTWHAHFGTMVDVHVVVALQGGRPLAAMPLQTRLKPAFRRFARQAVLPTETNAVRAFPMLASDRAAATAMYEYLARIDTPWDNLILCTPCSENALAPCLRGNGWLVLVRKGPLLHRIDLPPDGWSAYLRSRSPTLRDTLEAAHAQCDAGPLRFELLWIADRPALLDEYLVQEQLAPDDERGLGIGITSQQIAFYRELAERYAAPLGMFTGRLLAGDQIIAATVGYLWRRQMHVLHVTRDAQFASAGVAALGRLVEHCCLHELCTVIHVPDLTYAATADWATRSGASVIVHAERRGLAGRLHHALNWLRRGRDAIRAVRAVTAGSRP